MNEVLFRKKSLEKVSSPEQLNDYIRVANPGVWIILAAVIVLLIGICVWGIFGKIDTTVATVGSCSDGTLTCYVSDDDVYKVSAGMQVRVEDKDYTVLSVDKTPVKVSDNLNEHLAYLGGFDGDQWVYAVTVDADLPNGNYKAEIVVESVSMMSFVLN